MHAFAVALALLLQDPPTGDAVAVPVPEQGPSLARAAIQWCGERGPELFDVLEDGEPVARLRLRASVETRGEQRFLELVLDIQRPPGAEVPARLLTRLRTDEHLTPFDVRRWDTDPDRTLLAKMGVEGPKLTGRVGDRGVVRNVPAPIATETGVLLRAALLPREEGARVTLARIHFGRRGELQVALDERLVFLGFEELELSAPADGRPGTEDDAGGTPPGASPETLPVARVEHRTPRGRERATYWFDDGRRLVAARWKGRVTVEWRRVEQERDRP